MTTHLVNLFSGPALTSCGEMSAIPREVTSDVDKRTCSACRAAMVRGGHCPACGEKQLSWGTHPHKLTNVADGRLTANDIETIFYLACDYCSETVIPIVDPQVVAAALTEMGWVPK